MLSTSLDAAPRNTDPATLPVPDYTLIDVTKYWSEVIDPATGVLSNNVTGLLFANRGCPYTCSYCFVWFGAKIRRREPRQVVAEMRAQAEQGVRNFFFLDYTFTIIPGWVRELCELIRRGTGRVLALPDAGGTVNPELLADMRSAGCVGIYYGVESPWIGDIEMDKPTPQPVIEKAIQDTADAGIHPLIFILFGTENGEEEKARQLHEFLAGLPGTFHPSVLMPRPFTDRGPDPLSARRNREAGRSTTRSRPGCGTSCPAGPRWPTSTSRSCCCPTTSATCPPAVRTS
ncbi:radical SAM protein [Micromonospora sp. M12]